MPEVDFRETESRIVLNRVRISPGLSGNHLEFEKFLPGPLKTLENM